jgi:hypothetical protein
MTISRETDSFGLMTLDLPALEAPAFVTVTLPDGRRKRRHRRCARTSPITTVWRWRGG